MVILGNQTTASQNGEYTASGIGTAYTLTPNGLPTAAGDAWLILNGTVYTDSAFVANSAVPTATFTEFAGPTAYTFTSPLALSGRTVSVGYDNSTIGDNGSNQLYVPTGGIGTTQLAAASVTAAKLATVTDGTTLDQSGSGSTLEIKAGGVGTTQLASSAVTSAKIATTAVDGATITGGGGSALAVQYAPAVEQTFTSAVALAANTSYLVRLTLNSDSGTAGQVYLADASSAASAGKFWTIGMASGGASGVSIGGTVTVMMLGTWTLGSSDTAFGSTTVGMPVWLNTAGTFTTTAPSTSGYACVKVGIVKTTNSITMDGRQLTGVA